jgi:hypothetical protein
MFTRKVIMTFEALRPLTGNNNMISAATGRILLVAREDCFLFIKALGVSKFSLINTLVIAGTWFDTWTC